MNRALALCVLVPLVLPGCIAPGPGPDDDAFLDETADGLTSSQRRERSRQIRDAAAAEGLTDAGWLLAGIADAETQMAQCWYELTWACQGPPSADCGGGPVWVAVVTSVWVLIGPPASASGGRCR